MQNTTRVAGDKGQYGQAYAGENELQPQGYVSHSYSASPSEQLALWHANRGNKSFARAMIPSWKVEQPEERITKNPFKLMAMVSPIGWVMFIR